MRKANIFKGLLTATFAGALLGTAAAADDSAGLQILIDMQDPSQITKTFCVRDSKLYSLDAQIQVTNNFKMTCAAVDANDPSKGVKWVDPTAEPKEPPPAAPPAAPK